MGEGEALNNLYFNHLKANLGGVRNHYRKMRGSRTRKLVLGLPSIYMT